MENNNILLLEKFLQGKASKEEVKLLLTLLEETSTFDEWMSELWDESDNEIDAKIEDKMYDVISKKTKGKKRILFSNIWSVAASLLLLIVSSIAFYLYSENLEDNNIADMTFTVERGQKASATLPDGSKVWINSDSHITYGRDFGKKQRVIQLEGEAYFEVVSNSKSPFIVKTKDMSVKALGTAFNVKSYEEDAVTGVVLLNGKVEVSTKSEKVTLNPNQRIDYDKKSLTIIKTNVEDISYANSWRDNKFVFVDETLENITNMLARQYNVTFKYLDNSLRNQLFTGTIKNTSLESILQLFALTSPLDYEVKESIIELKENLKTKNKFREVIKP